MRIIYICWCIVLLCCAITTTAQETDFPTVDALNAVTFPPNDPIDLAQRLLGVVSNIQPPSMPPVYALGDSKAFRIVDVSSQQEQLKTTTLRAQSDNVLLWVEADVNMKASIAQQFVAQVDADIIQQVQHLWGIIEPAGIDGDTRLYIVMVNGLDASIGGYFSDVHTYPQAILPNSNQHEMIVINLSAFQSTDLLNPQILAVIAHEYQHVLRHFIDKDEETWLDEAFSMITEHHLNMQGQRSQVLGFLQSPDVQINHWVSDTRKYDRYGGVFLLVNYFTEQYGLDALRQFSNTAADGWRGLDHVLLALDGIRADDFFADWALANYFRDPATGYGYHTLSPDIPSARPIDSIITYPYDITRRTAQYSTDYFTAFRLSDAQTMTIALTQPEAVGLIPTQVFEGEQMLYAVPNDYADAHITRTVDLSDVTSATLRFRTWYDLEVFWDYAYVMVSTDDGATWDILPATTTRDRNPYHRAYGIGYTGQSFGWVQETVSLDAYVGQSVLLRFEVITDAASLRHGMAIDALTVDTLGYADGFEDTLDTWDAQGWIFTDNRIPQRTWVQVVQVIGRDVSVSRWLADAPDNTWTINLLDDVEMVLVAISPIAQQTMVSADYQLRVHLDG